MALHVRPATEIRPTAGYPADQLFVLTDTGYVIATIRRAIEITGEPWHWAIFGDAIGPTGQGMAKSAEDGKIALATAYRAWLAREGKDEETHVPRYSDRLGDDLLAQLNLIKLPGPAPAST